MRFPAAVGIEVAGTNRSQMVKLARAGATVLAIAK
jgi:hypothetical protein